MSQKYFKVLVADGSRRQYFTHIWAQSALRAQLSLQLTLDGQSRVLSVQEVKCPCDGRRKCQEHYR